jgi:D-alanyl-D-alanine carboxypeptidase
MLRTCALGAAALLAVSGCGATATPTSKLVTLAPSASAPPAMTPLGGDFQQVTTAVSAQLDKAVNQTLHKSGAPGVIVGLWAPGSTYVRAFGVADRKSRAPMNPAMNVRIGSVTKTFTITGLLRLVDQGKVGLDDPISKYVSGVPQGDRITIRELADMRSGLFPYSTNPDFVNALLSNPKRAFTPKELLGYAYKHPMSFVPGTKFEYSNTNTILLGLVIEKVSGKPLAAFMKQEVLVPAHLNHTLLPSGAEFPAPHAQGYTKKGPSGAETDATDWNPSWAWAAGAMISNLDELRAWAPILATGTLLKPATQAERLKTLPSGLPGIGYGLGIFNANGWTGHNGSLPGYETVDVYLPSANATLVVLVNTDVDAPGGPDVSSEFAEAITKIVTPANLYVLRGGSSGSPSPTVS